MNGGLYQFPATRFVCNSPWKQWWHLLSGVIEVGTALLAGNIQHAATELWKVKHSIETFHRILEGKGADVHIAREETLSDNIERGYYQ